VIDPFMGSGTTIVESIVNQRIGIGTDINEIAYLVAKVKTTPLNSMELLIELNEIEQYLKGSLNGQFNYFWERAASIVPKHERIDYWFKTAQKQKLGIILHRILAIKQIDIKDFYLVTFAQILKSCSIWLQKSIKPTRDLNKMDIEPMTQFLYHAKKMLKRQATFEKMVALNIKQNIDNQRVIACDDARQLPCATEKAQLIVTSPPYVTSYEYADLHQLPLLWLGHLDELTAFRKKFIGSSFKERTEKIDLKSDLANETIHRLKNKKAKEVETYFADMLEAFQEMKRVLKVGGKICMVIGNTKFQEVEILNAEVFAEQLESIGFKIYDVICREIPSKMLPSTRDKETGRFAKTANTDILAYPKEYILIAEKI
jgi:DNA modification methylase